MAVTLTAEQEAALGSGAIRIRTLVDLYLDSARYSFWDGDGNSEIGGQPYISAGGFASASAITMGADLGADGIELALDGTRLMQASEPDASDPAALLATFFDESYHLRRCEIRYAVFHAETDDLILLLRRYAGLIDQALINEQIDDGGATAALILRLESVARRYGRRTGRVRSNEDQQEIWAGDNFFSFCTASIQQERTLYWGRKGPASSASGPPLSSSGGPAHQAARAPSHNGGAA